MYGIPNLYIHANQATLVSESHMLTAEGKRCAY